MPRMRSAFTRLALGGACILIAACAAPTKSGGGRYIVSAPKASLYKYGPAQTYGPDFQLPIGTKLTVLESSWGFAKVVTDDGTTGYVATDELKPAPPEPKPELKPNPQQMYSGRPKRNDYQPTPGGPLFDVNDVPLPLPEETPPPPSKPLKFRY